MSCENRKLSPPLKGLPLSEVHRRGKKGGGKRSFQRKVEAETKVNGDNRTTIGGTPVAEGGDTQARGGSIELAIKLAHSQRQPEKEEGGTKEP